MTIPTPGSCSVYEWQSKAKQALDPILANKRNVVSKSADYTAAYGDDIILVDATAAARTITLPAAAPFAGKSFTVMKIDAANDVTIEGNGSETINGATNYALTAQWESATVTAYNGSWYIIA